MRRIYQLTLVSGLLALLCIPTTPPAEAASNAALKASSKSSSKSKEGEEDSGRTPYVEVLKHCKRLTAKDSDLTDARRTFILKDLKDHADDADIVKACGEVLKATPELASAVITVIADTETLGFMKVGSKLLDVPEHQGSLIAHFFKVSDQEAYDDLARLWLANATEGEHFDALSLGFMSTYAPTSAIVKFRDVLNLESAKSLVATRVPAAKVEAAAAEVRKRIHEIVAYQWNTVAEDADDLVKKWAEERQLLEKVEDTRKHKGTDIVTADFATGTSGKVRMLGPNYFFMGGSYANTTIDPSVVDEGYGLQIDFYLLDRKTSRPILELTFDDNEKPWTLSINDDHRWVLTSPKSVTVFDECRPEDGNWSFLEVLALAEISEFKNGIKRRHLRIRMAEGKKEVVEARVGTLTSIKVCGSGRFGMRPITTWNIKPHRVR